MWSSCRVESRMWPEPPARPPKVVREIAQTVHGVSEASGQTADAAASTRSAASDLTAVSKTLSEIVGRFQI